MVVVAALCGVAYADDINLLTNTPTTVAVSSSVANAAIVPDHIADGKLSTAWNSKTGELAGAWVAVRVPADAKVKAIKLTAGFAHKDKKNDLFTMNHRIKRVRITHAGKSTEHALDVENRGLQTIAVDLAGGDIEIRIVDVVPGSKPSWKEAAISELEVWGTVPKAVKSRPAFRIGGLDTAATLTREQCVKALFPDARGGRIGPNKDDEVVLDVQIVPVSEQLVVCAIDHKAKDGTLVTHAHAVVKRGTRSAVVGTMLEPSAEHTENKAEASGTGSRIKIDPIQLTSTETGVIVHVTETSHGPMHSGRETDSKLYRVNATGFVEVLAWKSRMSQGEADSGDECELEYPAPGKYMASRVTLVCTETTGDFHNDNHAKRGIFTKDRKERFVWKNGTYVPK